MSQYIKNRGRRVCTEWAFPTIVRGIFLAIAICVMCVSLVAQPGSENRRVLILYNNDSYTSTQTAIDRSLRAAVKDGSPAPVEVYSEYVGNTRTGTNYENEFVALLKRKYEGKKFDVIFSIGQFPLIMVLQHRNELFLHTPVVFLTIDQRLVAGLYPAPDLTGVWGEINFRQNLEIALDAHPNTEHVALIQGVSDTDKDWSRRAKDEFREFTSRLDFIDLVGLTVPEMRSSLATLPPNTIVFLVSNIKDNAGNTYETPDYLSQVASASSAPIYGTTDGQLGNGIVGGRLLGFDALGTEGGQMGLRLMAGEKPETIPPHASRNSPVFDWRQLRRWGISESSLPPDSVIQFKEQTLWEEYRWYAIGLIAAVVAETLLIGLLIYLGYRRRQAEAEAARLSGRITEIVANVPGIVWESRFDAAINGRRTTFISDYVYRMLGYTPAEWLEQPPGFGLRIVPEEDRDKAKKESDLASTNGKEFISEYRWLTKHGDVRWVENHMSPIVENPSGIVGLRGVVLDITDRKLAEQHAHEAEEKDKAILAAIPDLMFLQNIEGDYLDYHAKDPDDLFVTAEHFIGKNVRDIMPPNLATQFLSCFARATEGSEPQFLEYSLEMRGEDRWFEARMVRIGDKILSIVRDISERKEAEAELGFQARMLNTVEQAVVASDMDGVVFYWNQFAEELYGWSAYEAIGKPVKDLLQFRNFREKAKEIWLQLQDGKGWAGEITLNRRDGKELHIWVNDSPIFDDKGDVVGVIGISHDVSERIRDQKALKQSEEFSRTILSSLSSHVCVIDRSGVIVAVNSGWVEFAASNGLPVTKTVGIGVNYLEVCRSAAYSGDDLADRALDGIKCVCEGTQEYFSLEYPCHAPDKQRWFQLSVTPLKGGDGGAVVVHTDISQRKQAETDLAGSHRRTSEILESIGDAFYSVDSEMRFTYVNRRTEELWGKRREELIGRTFLDVFPELSGTQTHHEIQAAISDGQPRSYETFSPLLSRWVDVSVYPSAGGGLSIYFRDITERKTAEEALRKSERRLRLAQQAARVGTWELDIETGRSEWSDMIWELFGLEKSEQPMNDNEFIKLIHPDDRNNALKKVQSALTGVEDEYIDEFRVVQPDGQIIWLSSRGAVIRSGTGQPERMVGVNIDITARKAADEAVREREARFRDMAEAAPVAIWMSNVDQSTTYISRQWREMTGSSLEDNLGSGWSKFVHQDDLDILAKTYTDSFQKRVPFETEFRVRRTNGEYRWVLGVGTPRFNAEGDFHGYIGSAIDITERREAEDEIRRAHDELKVLKNQLEAENIYLQQELQQDQSFGDIVGQSAGIKYVMFKVKQVGPTDASVLIAGETGTGKELVARAIHEASSRKNRPLIKVNCAALTPSLIESELFGHEKGSFTGAVGRKIGRFELANGGTLLLDEISELPLDLQAKLLRVLQDGEFERVGGDRTLKIDARIVAATNRDLKEEVDQGRFREDLWYRLNVFPITTPPLRERKDDIPLLTEHFVSMFSRKFGKDIKAVSPKTMAALTAHRWPGNVRELANVIERAVINSDGPVLRLQEDLPGPRSAKSIIGGGTLEDVERDHIIRVLEELNWRIDGPKGGARILGINPSTLRTRMTKLGVHKPDGRLMGESN